MKITLNELKSIVKQILKEEEISGQKIYNDFFDKFKGKSGFIGEIVINRADEKIFEVRFDSEQDAKEAKDYLSTFNVDFYGNMLNTKNFMVKLP